MSAIHLTKDNFNQEVVESKVPVLVDFFATWCGPCKMVAPILDELSEELQDVKIVKVDVDAESELARSHRIMSVPTFFLYKDGKAIKRESGGRTKDELIELINAAR